MKGETLDRRIRKTRRVIRQCLTELLKTKRNQDITVREIRGAGGRAESFQSF